MKADSSSSRPPRYESIFNEKTGWRHRAYAPVGHEARHVANVRRGDTYAFYYSCDDAQWMASVYYGGEERILLEGAVYRLSI